jgi:hypothetical protein
MWSLPAIWRPQIAPRRRLPRDSKRCRARVVTMSLKGHAVCFKKRSRGRPADVAKQMKLFVVCMPKHSCRSVWLERPRALCRPRPGQLADTAVSRRTEIDAITPPRVSQLFASRNTSREAARTSLKQEAT